MSKTDDKISQMFGVPTGAPTSNLNKPVSKNVDDEIENDGYPTIPKDKDLPIEVKNPEYRTKQKDQDFDYARKTIHSAINHSNDALKELVHFANNSGGPQAYKEVGNLLKNITTASQTLLSIHKEIEQLSNGNNGNKTSNTSQAESEEILDEEEDFGKTGVEYLDEILDSEDDEEDIWADTKLDDE